MITLTAYDIINHLTCCDDELRQCKIKVGYENDDVRKTNAILVGDNIVHNGKIPFRITVHGISNKGYTTAKIMNMIKKYDKQFITINKDKVDYLVGIYFEAVFGAGVDDVNRNVITAMLSCTVSEQK